MIKTLDYIECFLMNNFRILALIIIRMWYNIFVRLCVCTSSSMDRASVSGADDMGSTPI